MPVGRRAGVEVDRTERGDTHRLESAVLTLLVAKPAGGLGALRAQGGLPGLEREWL